MNLARAGLGPGLVLIAVLALTGCTSGTSGTGTASSALTSASATGSSSPAPTTSAASTATSGPTTSAATSPATPAACTGTQLTVSWANPPGGGAAGHVGIVLLFKNSSASACVLSGYPGADGVDSAGQTLASATRTLNGMIGFCGCTTPPTLTLAPGTVVSAVAEGDAGGSGPCTAFPGMLVTPPNTTTSTRIPAAPYSCGFTVHPVVTGSAGQSGTP